MKLKICIAHILKLIKIKTLYKIESNPTTQKHQLTTNTTQTQNLQHRHKNKNKKNKKTIYKC